MLGGGSSFEWVTTSPVACWGVYAQPGLVTAPPLTPPPPAPVQVYQDVLACGNQVADEVLSQSKTVRTFGTEMQEEQRYSGWLG